jgi:hypothetical protein
VLGGFTVREVLMLGLIIAYPLILYTPLWKMAFALRNIKIPSCSKFLDEFEKRKQELLDYKTTPKCLKNILVNTSKTKAYRLHPQLFYLGYIFSSDTYKTPRMQLAVGLEILYCSTVNNVNEHKEQLLKYTKTLFEKNIEALKYMDGSKRHALIKRFTQLTNRIITDDAKVASSAYVLSQDSPSMPRLQVTLASNKIFLQECLCLGYESNPECDGLNKVYIEQIGSKLEVIFQELTNPGAAAYKHTDTLVNNTKQIANKLDNHEAWAEEFNNFLDAMVSSLKGSTD